MKKKIRGQRGAAELLQVLLISGMMLVMVVTLFYPQMQKVFTTITNSMNTWVADEAVECFE